MDDKPSFNITFEMMGNRLSCSPPSSYFKTFFMPLHKSNTDDTNVNFVLGDNDQESRCYEPQYLAGRNVRDVGLKELMRQLKWCPERCLCYLRPWDGYKVVNCSYRNFDYFPELNKVYKNPNSDYTDPNSIELDMTGNLLTRVAEEDLPPDYNKERVISDFKVYLSNNQIKEFTWVPRSNLKVSVIQVILSVNLKIDTISVLVTIFLNSCFTCGLV